MLKSSSNCLWVSSKNSSFAVKNRSVKVIDSVATAEKPSMVPEIVLQPIKDISSTVKLLGSKSLSSNIVLLATLSENDYMPPEWLPLLQMVVGRITDDEEETSVYLQLLSTLMEIGSENVAPSILDIVQLLVGAILRCIPPSPDPWPQFLSRVADVFSDYLGSLNEDLIKDNFVIVYEILKHEWPARWQRFILDLVRLCRNILRIGNKNFR